MAKQLFAQVRKSAGKWRTNTNFDLHWSNPEYLTNRSQLSSPSTDSLLQAGMEDLKDFDYNTYLEDGAVVPCIDTHVEEGHEEPGQFSKACPWCNRFFFNWLVTHDKGDFIQPISTECGTLPAPPSAPAIDNSQYTVDSQFQFFIDKGAKTKGRAPTYQTKHNERWTTVSAQNVAAIKSQSVTQPAEGDLQTKFTKLPRSQAAVRSWVKKNCSYDPNELDSYPASDNLFVIPSPDYPTNPDVPKHLLMRFDKAIPLDTQKRLWHHWCELRNVLKTSDKNQHRDEIAAAHFGIWQHYSKNAYVTSDTLKQAALAQPHIKAFLKILKKEVARKLWNLLMRYDPETLERQIKLCNHLRQNETFMKKMEEMPHIDFGGIFFTAAVKEGGSQRVHLDWMDHIGTYAWVICIGPGWEGGELCLPQLGKKVPTKSGQVIAFRARYLAHFAAPSVGGRLVITGFTDRNLMNSALKPEKSTAVVAPSQGQKRKRE